MNREEALKRSDDALKELADSLRQGKSEALVAYLDMMSKFHRYSFGNCILIAMQKPNATLVAGFSRWRQLHRCVKKGEAGIAILAPLFLRKKPASDETQEDEQPREGKERAVSGFRIVYVFDVSQTEGKELPELGMIAGDPGAMIDKMEALIRSKGIELTYVETLGGALGVSEGGRIGILSTLPPAERFSTLVHELGHELLHRGDRRKYTDKAIRETEAEAVAYVVSRAIGLDVSTKSSDYIQLWSGDVLTLLQSLELVRDVSTQILTALENLQVEEVANHVE